MLDKFVNTLKEKGEVYLRLKINPGARVNEFLEILEDDTIKINIASQAERGRANQELVKFLAKTFGVAKSEVKIISGAGNRVKLIKIKKI